MIFRNERIFNEKKIIIIIVASLLLTVKLDAEMLDNNKLEKEVLSKYTQEEIEYFGGLDNVIENERLDKEKIDKVKGFLLEKEERNKKRDLLYEEMLKTKSFDTSKLERNIISEQTANSSVPFETWTDKLGNHGGKFVGYYLKSQEKGWWCGPASVQTAIGIITGEIVSQSTIAKEQNTDALGATSEQQIHTSLNKHQSVNSYGWRMLSKYADRYSALEEALYTDLAINHVPALIEVNTKTLVMYGGKELGHFLTVVGYDDIRRLTTGTATYGFTYADNNDNYVGPYGNVFGEAADELRVLANATNYVIW